jgi:hypothetical protein
MDVCVCLSGADGRVVEGRATLFRHHREVSRVRIPGRMGLPWMFVFVFVLWRPEKGGRRRKKADRKVPDRPVVVKGERLFKKKKKKKKKNKRSPLIFVLELLIPY